MALAKLSPPVQPLVVARPRLFRRIDAARRSGCVWIAGPAGAGKTTLVASYLEMRKACRIWYRLDESDADLASLFHYLSVAVNATATRSTPSLPVLTPQRALPTFFRRFFECLGERFRLPTVLVFDNYQDLSKGAALHEWLPNGVSALPSHVSIVILSREPPATPFAALEANRQLSRIGPEELVLTAAEIRRLVALHRPRASRQHALALRQRAEGANGWAAGTVLLLEPSSFGELKTLNIAQASPTLFAYLAMEVVGRMSSELQACLLDICVMPEMTTAMAEELSGSAAAGEFLVALHRTRNFVERVQRMEPWYRFHPLFRDTLLELARTSRSAPQLERLRQHAAAMFIACGRFEDGVELLTEAKSWPELAQLITDAAPGLLRHGRFDTLAGWITRIPAAERAQRPWLDYWFAVSRMPFAPVEATALFAEALARFTVAGDRPGAIASWGGAAATTVAQMGDLSELDHWLARCPFDSPDDLAELPDAVALQAADALTSCLVWRAPGTAQTEHWVSHVDRLRRRIGLLQQVVPVPFWETYQLWKGDVSAARRGFEVLKGLMSTRLDQPTVCGMHHYAEAVLAWYEGDAQRCRAAVASVLEMSRTEGTQSWDYAVLGQAVYNELLQGDFIAARHFLEMIRPPIHLRRSMIAQHYHFLSAWCHLQQDDFDAAWQSQDPDISCSPEVSGPFAEACDLIVSAFAARGRGDRVEAAKRQQRIAAIAEAMDSDLLRFAAAFIGAALAFDADAEDEGWILLRSGLTIGRRRNLVGFVGWHAPTVAALCLKALEGGIEVEYVHRLLRTRWLPAPPEARSTDVWPWPIRIRALGAFSVETQGQSLLTRRRTPHRQLELLKVLVASGANGVRLQALSDLLWPDSEGDAAKETLDKTLQRLRRWLGYRDAIPVRGGRLVLNPDVCWVDARAFDTLATNLLKPRDGAYRSPARFAREVQRARNLYRGPFLSAHAEGWARSVRHRLERKFEAINLLTDVKSPRREYVSPNLSPSIL
jgi:LuxR family transcriptional regulator, maltose regulon positive regulatory protein